MLVLDCIEYLFYFFWLVLSESQERMLVIVKKGQEKAVEKIFDKWDLTWAIIGEVTDTARVQYYMNNELVADIPGESLVLGGGASMSGMAEIAEEIFALPVRIGAPQEMMIQHDLGLGPKFATAVGLVRQGNRQYAEMIASGNNSESWTKRTSHKVRKFISEIF